MIEIRPELRIDKFSLVRNSSSALSSRERILPLDYLVDLLGTETRKHYLVGSTSGSFDILHVGHLRYIEDLVKTTHLRSQLAGKDPLVIIGINSDESTRRNREDRTRGRPVFTEIRRAELIAGFKGVNAVFLFDDNFDLAKLEPDIFQVFTLSDHSPETRPEVLIMRQRGTEIVMIHDDDRPDSTSSILKRIHQNNIT